MCKLIDCELFPVLIRKKIAGITVYQKIDAQPSGQDEDNNVAGNFYVSKYKMDIPYFKDINKALYSVDDKTKGVVIASSQVSIAQKVARYIEDYIAVKAHERNRKEVNDIFSAYTGEEQFFYDDDDDENVILAKDLYSFSLNIQTDGQKDAGNIYVRFIQKGGPDADDTVLYTDINTGTDIEDKIDAILSSRNGGTYIHISPHQVNEPWVSDLILNHDYEIVCIEDLDSEYYVSIFNALINESGYILEDGFSAVDAVSMIRRKMGNEFKEEDINNSIIYAIKKCGGRNDKNVLRRCDFTVTGKVEKYATEMLEEMPGLDTPKKMIKEMIALCKAEANNEKLSGLHKNMIFAGNPGTAKSTMAEITGRLLAESAISNGKFVVATRSDLIGEYVGKTAVKTAKKFEDARGGVLLIDEAAFLINTDSGGYVKECIKEIVRYMELYPDVMVIMACYDNEVQDLLNLDEGLSSRFSRIIHFEDYTDDVIVKIMDYMYRTLGYEYDEKGKTLIRDYINRKRQEKNFGNAREVRKIVEGSIIKQSLRNMEENAGFSTLISVSDIKEAIEELNSKLVKEKVSFGFC